jgi:hypothetical protein
MRKRLIYPDYKLTYYELFNEHVISLEKIHVQKNSNLNCNQFELHVQKMQTDYMLIEQFIISQIIVRGKSVFSIHLTPLIYKIDGVAKKNKNLK